MTDEERARLVRFRPEASESGPTIALSKRSGGKTPVAASGNAVWAGSESGFTVLRIDPVTGEVVARVPKLQSPHAIATGDEGVWVLEFSDRVASRIDPASNERVVRVPVGAYPSGLAVGAGSVWVGENMRNLVWQLDPVAHALRQTIHVGNDPEGSPWARGPRGSRTRSTGP